MYANLKTLDNFPRDNFYAIFPCLMQNALLSHVIGKYYLLHPLHFQCILRHRGSLSTPETLVRRPHISGCRCAWYDLLVGKKDFISSLLLLCLWCLFYFLSLVVLNGSLKNNHGKWIEWAEATTDGWHTVSLVRGGAGCDVAKAGHELSM